MKMKMNRETIIKYRAMMGCKESGRDGERGIKWVNSSVETKLERKGKIGKERDGEYERGGEVDREVERERKIAR